MVNAQGMVRHFAWIIVAYIAAACMAGLLAAIAFYFVLSPSGAGTDGVPFASYLFFGIYLAALAAAIPAFAFIAVSEWRRWRDWPIHTAAGALTGVIGPMFILFGADPRRIELPFLVLGICIGAVCGLIYWRLAGRAAGSWHAH